MSKFCTRKGDGSTIYLTKEQIRQDIADGAADAADMGGIKEITSNEMDHLLDIICSKNKIVSVERGQEVVLSYDVGQLDMCGDNGNSGGGIPASRFNGALVHERTLCADTFELAHSDYSIKPVKPVIANEMNDMEVIQNNIVIPFFYGAMPNMGLYYKPDGPYGNPADLMREFKIEEAQREADAAANHMAKDIAFVGAKIFEAGSDGFNFDTTGSAGDADFVGVLRGIEALRKECPDINLMLGMAGENVMGIHGEIEYDGQVVAGMFPHQQVKLAEKVGANVFGPVSNTNTGKSLAWNLSRAVTFVKSCSEVSSIPLHVNMGMGVGGIPMSETPPMDAVTRCSKAMVEIAKVDGI